MVATKQALNCKKRPENGKKENALPTDKPPYRPIYWNIESPARDRKTLSYSYRSLNIFTMSLQNQHDTLHVCYMYVTCMSRMKRNNILSLVVQLNPA